MHAKVPLAEWAELEAAVAVINLKLKNKLVRFSRFATLAGLATFSMLGYQNCMGQKVDLSSSTPGASEAAVCAPTSTDLANFSSAAQELQTSCVMCHANTSNSASASFRLYTAASPGDVNATTGNLCSINLMKTATVLGTIISGPPHPILATDAIEPNLLAYLRSH